LAADEQAWHRPSQAVSQQTPSMQWPDWHSDAVPQDAPAIRSAMQTPEAWQYPDGAHSDSEAQVVLHVALVPPHTEGAQLGLPVDPAGRGLQVPFALDPRLAAQTSQGSAHGLSQQNPSAHVPTPPAQTRQRPTRQSKPAASLQGVPWPWRTWHVASAAQ
jgi:hypothetical protein